MSHLIHESQYQVECLNPNMGYYFKSSKLLFTGESRFQKMEVHEFAGYGRVLRLDNIFQTSDWDEFLYHEPLAHVPAISLASQSVAPQKALVIGGGDGGMIEELLKYSSLKKVVMVELDEQVVEVSKKYLPKISNGAFDDSRTELLFEDGVAYIENSKDKFDQVILDLTDPIGPSVMLYTKEFYQAIANILTEQGTLSLHIESPISRPQVFSQLIWTLKSVFKHVRPMLNYVPMYGTLWAYAVASQQTDPLAIEKDAIKKSIEKFQLKDLKFYNPDTHKALLALPNYVQDLLEKPQELFTRNNPIHIEEGYTTELFLGRKP